MIWILTLSQLLFANSYVRNLDQLNITHQELVSQERVIKKLINKKNRTEDPEEIKEILKELMEKHEAFGKVIERYEGQRSKIKIMFPLKIKEVDNRHPKYKIKTFDQLMKEDGVPEKLDSNLKLLEKQYGVHKEEGVVHDSTGNLTADQQKERKDRLDVKRSKTDWDSRIIIEK